MVSLSVMNNDFDEPRVRVRVSTDASPADFNFKDQPRVSQFHQIRVSAVDVDDDSRVLECNVNGSSLGSDDVVHGDGEDQFRVQDDVDMNPKAGGIGIDDALGSPRASDDDATTNGEFRLERRGNLRGSERNDVDASDVDVDVGSMKILGSEFEMGDMVWGKVKSHPWWPGHIYNEAFATSSVRRSRRDGHVLVAFFGDSSYGWFDLTELVPYEPHYAEKSQQTSSRNFMNAVEESVDEASRRSALGLSCKCRNPYNFRPANVPGYMVVDVVDFEPATIYSVSQIRKARDSFRPAETLSFIKQLAASPSGESNSFDFITHKAAALAFRRSVFEEFDETYAEAFGHQPVRPSESPTPKEPSRAPLSGPLVMAEALGGRKGSSKGTKPKEVSKKDKYLFKRRDEAGNLRKNQTSQAHGSSSSPSTYQQGTSNSPAASYVFQKRDQIVSIKDEFSGAPPMDIKDISNEGLDVLASSAISVKMGSPGPASGGPEQLESSIPDNRFGGVSANDGGHVGMSSDLFKKRKKKAAKHPAGEQSYEKLDISEKKTNKKLRKNEVHSEIVPSSYGGLIKPEAKPMKKAFSSRERNDFASDSVSQQVGLGPQGFVEGNGDELPDLLADLLGLALNPFHGVERKRPAAVHQFFLKFRALVFLKSSSASPPPPESEPSETRAIRSPPPSDRTPTKKSKLSGRHDDPTKGGRKRVPSERQEENAAKRAKKITDVKSLAAEKKAAALLKNPNPELHQTDGKAKSSTTPPFSRLTKTDQQSKKKSDRPPRIEEPTYLVMKFQSGSSLPSLTELKARFARFGPLDTSLSRVFYKTNTCRVAFLYKQDANIACRYAVTNPHFPNVKVLLRPVAETQPQQQPGNGRAEDSLPGDSLSNRDSSTTEPRSLLPQQPGQQLKSCLKKPSGSDEPGVGPTNGSGSVKMARVRFNMGEDIAGASNNQRTGVQAQMTDSRNANLSSESGPSSSSSSASVAMDSVSNNQRFFSLNPLQPPLLPNPPPQFLRPPPPFNLPHPRHFEVPPRNNVNFNVSGPLGQASLPPPPPPPPPSIDISQQMMSLLTRCHDVVTNLKSVIGYVPYHPL